MAWLASCSLVIMDERMLNAKSKETDPGAELMLRIAVSRVVFVQVSNDACFQNTVRIFAFRKAELNMHLRRWSRVVESNQGAWIMDWVAPSWCFRR